MIVPLVTLASLFLATKALSQSPGHGNYSSSLPSSDAQFKSQFNNLVWADEFNNGISGDWTYDIGGGGWGNNELEYYRSENAWTDGGNLVIVAKRESYGGRDYTSARLKTQGRRSWRYGRMEARMKVPVFMGSWPAFWMLGDSISWEGWPSCGEIDIMETVNVDNTCYGTVHWSDNNGNYASYGGKMGNSMADWHTYSVEWTSTTITWYVDGRQYHIIDITNGINGTGEFQNTFFFILNLAIGGNWPGFNIDNGAFPAYMFVDYVRVYQ